MSFPATGRVLAALLGTLVGCSGARSDAAARPAGGAAVAEGAAAAEFDGAAALAAVRAQLAFGPRVPGTPAHQAAGDWLVAELTRRADTVVVQRWTHRAADGRALPLRNILARFRPEAARRVLYVAHWDSRPVADGSGARDRTAAVPGGNDGGSGVAILLGVAEALARRPAAVGVDLLLVDGEDFGDFDTDTDVLLGSRYFADHLPAPGYAPLFGVLWDMVGEPGAVFEQEANSAQGAPEVVRRVWSTAQRLGYGAMFTNRAGLSITDDHVPLLAKGLRVVDVIDLDYAWHHTAEDTADKVSAETLEAVGRVAVVLIRELDG